MTDVSQNRQRPIGDQSAALPLTDAAAALGISENALRLRIRRHQVNAHKRDGRWYVVVNQSPPESDQPVTIPADQSETFAALRGTIDILQADVAYLRDQLGQRSTELAIERERSDVLQQLALNRIPQLPIGDSSEKPTDHPTASPTGQGEAIAPDMASDTSGSGARSWWRRILG